MDSIWPVEPLPWYALAAIDVAVLVSESEIVRVAMQRLRTHQYRRG